METHARAGAEGGYELGPRRMAIASIAMIVVAAVLVAVAARDAVAGLAVSALMAEGACVALLCINASGNHAPVRRLTTRRREISLACASALVLGAIGMAVGTISGNAPVTAVVLASAAAAALGAFVATAAMCLSSSA
jgi:hypothetical protein